MCHCGCQNLYTPLKSNGEGTSVLPASLLLCAAILWYLVIYDQICLQFSMGFFWLLVLYESFRKYFLNVISVKLWRHLKDTQTCQSSLQLVCIIRTVSRRWIFQQGNCIWWVLVLMCKDFTTLKIALHWLRQFIFFWERGRTKAIFGLMCIEASIKLSTLILIKAAWLMFRQGNRTNLGMAGRPCLVLCYQIPNFSSICEVYILLMLYLCYYSVNFYYIWQVSWKHQSVYFLRYGGFLWYSQDTGLLKIVAVDATDWAEWSLF